MTLQPRLRYNIFMLIVNHLIFKDFQIGVNLGIGPKN